MRLRQPWIRRPALGIFALSTFAPIAPFVIACGGDDVEADSDGAPTGTESSSTGLTGASSFTSGPASTSLTSPTSTSSTETTLDVISTDTGADDEPYMRDCPPARVAGPEIDDFEGSGPYVSFDDGRVHGWFSYDDGTNGTLTPSPYDAHSHEDAYAGRGAAHIEAEGFTYWGVGLVLALNVTGVGDCPADASAYDGITFWARGLGRVYVHFSTLQTLPPDYGGACASDCWDDHGLDIDLTDEWQPFTIRWTDLKQRGFGRRATFDPTELVFIHWQDESALEVDIWVDELRFISDDSESSTGTGTGDTGTGDTGDDMTSSSTSVGTEDGSTGSDATSSTSDGSTSDGSTASASTGESTTDAESTGSSEGTATDDIATGDDGDSIPDA